MLEALEKAKDLRDKFASVTPMIDKPFDALVKAGEMCRFSCFMLERFSLPPAQYKGTELRDIVVREMRALRLKLGSKELNIVPRPLLQHCHSILWNGK